MMPLCALVEGRPVVAPDLSGREWEDLKTRHRNGLPVTMRCCGAPGHLRTSKQGTRHFYHASGSGCVYAPETEEHLEIKERIYRACRAEGWETQVECAAPSRNWIADVCATRDGRTVAFEVQISPLSPDELEGRDLKYRAEGIESYWLLAQFTVRPGDPSFRSDAFPGNNALADPVPYIDDSVFLTGPENHLFIARGIRGIGLDARGMRLFTTNNPAIPVGVWVREVLRGNYRRYLEETAAALEQKRRLKEMAAPALCRFRDYYEKIVRNGTYRRRAEGMHRLIGSGPALEHTPALLRKANAIAAEIDWLEKEYRSFNAESSGLFTWKKPAGSSTIRPFFRLESERKVRQLQECVMVFDRWETSFNAAVDSLEQDLYSARSRR